MPDDVTRHAAVPADPKGSMRDQPAPEAKAPDSKLPEAKATVAKTDAAAQAPEPDPNDARRAKARI